MATIKIIILKCPKLNSEYTAFIFPLINVGMSSVFLLFELGGSEHSQCYLLQNISYCLPFNSQETPRLVPYLGGVAILLATSCDRNWSKVPRAVGIKRL